VEHEAIDLSRHAEVSSEMRSVVGSVAADDEVENAVSITVLMRRKNSRGGMRDSSHRDSE